MTYKALIDIGDYKAGEIVPDETALVWAGMYEESPVEKVGEDSQISSEDLKEEPEEKSNAMHDDYLNRNADVVRNAIREDELDKDTLESLLKIESSDKKRKPVIKELKSKIKALK